MWGNVCVLGSVGVDVLVFVCVCVDLCCVCNMYVCSFSCFVFHWLGELLANLSPLFPELPRRFVSTFVFCTCDRRSTRSWLLS